MTEQETILREFPPNPYLVNYHTRRQLTKQMSERYLPGKNEYPESWISALGGLEALSNIHIMRHKLRLKRRGESGWDDIIDEVERILCRHWNPIEIHELPGRIDTRRSYRLPDGMEFEKRRVYEGVYHSRNHQLAARLYQISGITTLVFYQGEVSVKRAYCFPWGELEPQILQCLNRPYERTEPG